MPLTHIVSYSGGVSSWAAARIVRDEHPDAPMVLLFADTLIEDEETYQFLEAGAKNLGLPITRIADGRTPWQVFRDKRFLGNSRTDPCSRILKRDLMAKWRNDNFTTDNCVQIVGLDATEEHRFWKHARAMEPWKVAAPLIAHGYFKADCEKLARNHGLPRQRLYRMGMAHANCGGGCVKMGQSGWAILLEQMPERYAEWERNEEEMRQFLGKDVAIMRDRRRKQGFDRPMTLREFRERRQQGRLPLPKEPEFGGCGCALATDPSETEKVVSTTPETTR